MWKSLYSQTGHRWQYNRVHCAWYAAWLGLQSQAFTKRNGCFFCTTTIATRTRLCPFRRALPVLLCLELQAPCFSKHFYHIATCAVRGADWHKHRGEGEAFPCSAWWIIWSMCKLCFSPLVLQLTCGLSFSFANTQETWIRQASTCDLCYSGKGMCQLFWVCVCSLSYTAWNAHAPYCNLWPVRLYGIFPHFLIKGTILRKNYWITKYVL